MNDGLQAYCDECSAVHDRQRQAAKGKAVRKRIEVPGGCTFCPGCNQVKSLDVWARNGAGRDGYQSYCKACKAMQGRVSYFERAHGLSADDVAKLLAQFPVCPICWVNPPLHVDHDHRTGKVRGVLCFTCNAAIGQLRDDAETAPRAAAYLEGVA